MAHLTAGITWIQTAGYEGRHRERQNGNADELLGHNSMDYHVQHMPSHNDVGHVLLQVAGFHDDLALDHAGGVAPDHLVPSRTRRPPLRRAGHAPSPYKDRTVAWSSKRVTGSTPAAATGSVPVLHAQGHVCRQGVRQSPQICGLDLDAAPPHTPCSVPELSPLLRLLLGTRDPFASRKEVWPGPICEPSWRARPPEQRGS